MAKENFWFGMLVMVLAFGMMVVGCNNDPTDKSTDSMLNGTWIGTGGTSSETRPYQVITDETGKIISWIDPWTGEMISGEPPAGAGERVTELEAKLKFNNGNFEYSVDGILFMKGSYTTNAGKLTLNPTHYYGEFFGLESKWYSKNELKTLFPDEDIDGQFSQITSNYSVSSNTLIYALFGGESQTYIKK